MDLELSKLLPLLIPVLIIQIGLQIYALVDLSRQIETRGPKWLWVIVILALEILGPFIYFFYGRKQE